MSSKQKIPVIKNIIKNVKESITYLDDDINEARRNINKHVLTGNASETLVYKDTLQRLRQRGLDETHYSVSEGGILSAYQHIIREKLKEKEELENSLLRLNQDLQLLQSEFRPTKSAAAKFSTRNMDDTQATMLQNSLMRKYNTMKKRSKTRSGSPKSASKKGGRKKKTKRRRR
tara:strand:- start:2940 stop:3461 length:522 start_codon:yes stop_codon:yes gene_type:complete